MLMFALFAAHNTIVVVEVVNSCQQFERVDFFELIVRWLRQTKTHTPHAHEQIHMNTHTHAHTDTYTNTYTHENNLA